MPQRHRCQAPLAEFLIRLLCALARAVPPLGAMGDAVLLQCVGLEVVGRLHPLAVGLPWEAIVAPKSAALEAVAKEAFAGVSRLGRKKFMAWHGAVRALDDYTFVDALARAYNDAVPRILNCGERLVLDECVLDRKAFTRNLAKKPGQKGVEFITAATGVHGSGGSATWFMLPHVWNAGRGPSMDSIVQSATETAWTGVPEHMRPLLVMDCRFLTNDSLRYLVSARGRPFLASAHSHWFGTLAAKAREWVNWAEQEVRPESYTGSVTLVRSGPECTPADFGQNLSKSWPFREQAAGGRAALQRH